MVYVEVPCEAEFDQINVLGRSWNVDPADRRSNSMLFLPDPL